MKNQYTHILLFLITSFIVACGDSGDKPDAFGNFEADEVIVSAENSGKVLWSHVQEGRHIDSGEQVLVIDTSQLYFQKVQLISRIEAIRKKLPDEASQLASYSERIETLKSEIKRFERLVESKAAPSKSLDDLRSELDLAVSQRIAVASTLSTQTQGLLAEIEPLKAQLMQVEDLIGRSTVINPVSGTVLTSLIKTGEMAMQGRGLYKIAPLNPIILRAYVTEDQLSQLAIGQNLEVRTDGPEGVMDSHTGIVRWVSSEAEFTPKMIQTRDERTAQVYAIKIEVENNGSLKIGMPAEVFLTSDQEENKD